MSVKVVSRAGRPPERKLRMSSSPRLMSPRASLKNVINSLAAVRMSVSGAFVCWCPAGASLRGGIGFEGCVMGRSWDVVWDVGGRGRFMSVRVGFVAGVL